jgi:hypothetical protein
LEVRIVIELACKHNEFEHHPIKVDCPKSIDGCLHDETCSGPMRMVLDDTWTRSLTEGL